MHRQRRKPTIGKGLLVILLAAFAALALVATACQGEERPAVEVVGEDGTATGTGTGTGTATGAEEPGEFGLIEPPRGATTLNIDMHEWEVIPEPREVPAGDVYIRVKNNGEEPHDFVIIRSDLPHDQLPELDGWIREDRIDVVGHLVVWEPGSQASGLFTLTPGNYVVICNIVEKEPSGEIESHYVQGMHNSLTVK